VSYLFCSHKYKKFVNYFSFELAEIKIWANLQRIIELFTQKLSLSFQNIGLGSEIREPEKNLFQIPDPGAKRHRIPDPGFETLEKYFSLPGWRQRRKSGSCVRNG
jgi:hypothetical protein